MTEASLHFVVCTRNNREIIGETLSALAAQTVSGFLCTVVDACSTDGTADYVREEFDWVRVIVKEEDSGPAASRNIGFLTSDSEFLVFLDSDVSLEPEWAARQLEFMELHPDVGMVGGKLVYASQPEILNVAYGGLNRLAVAWDVGNFEPESAYGSNRESIWLSTSALMVRRSVMEHIGLFDELMFAFQEDVDLGWRANIAGHRLVYNSAVKALHRVHGTMNDSTMGTRITYLAWRNRLRSILINYELHNVIVYGLLYLLLNIPMVLFKPRRLEKLRAIFWNVGNVGSTLERRRAVQRIRVVSDRSLWHLFETGFRGPGY